MQNTADLARSYELNLLGNTATQSPKLFSDLCISSQVYHQDSWERQQGFVFKIPCLAQQSTQKAVDVPFSTQEEILKEDLEDELELHDIQATVEEISPCIFAAQLEYGHRFY